MSQHTPGPWDDASQYPEIPTIRIFAGTVHVATVAAQHSPEKTKANARLIAAAPELLATLADCEGLIDSLVLRGIGDWLPPGTKDIYKTVHTKAKVAIAKATATIKEEEQEPPEPDTCHECGEIAVGYAEDTPYCATHYRRRPSIHTKLPRTTPKPTPS